MAAHLTDEIWSHSENSSQIPHLLSDHLQAVGQQAAFFASRFGQTKRAKLAGVSHDLGKADPEFQAYLRQQRKTSPGVGHAVAGALAVGELDPDAAWAVLSHHAGLKNLAAMRQRCSDAQPDPGTVASLEYSSSLLDFWSAGSTSEMAWRVGNLDLTQSGQRQRWIGNDLLARWLLSVLVDADRLDTEAHFDAQRAIGRGAPPGLAVAAARFSEKRSTAIGVRSADPMNVLRDRVRDVVVSVLSSSDVGVYTLTAPTGAGKTLTVLEAAFAHAERNGLDRIVMAAPFTSVVTQTAQVMRSLMDHDGDVLLEHHSNVIEPDEDDGVGQGSGEVSGRLVAENWDRPLIATTSVQLLETLFSNKPSKVRKLHRLAKSVVIVDEVQSIPWDLLEPAVRMLAQVAEQFGSTVLLCTATQPPIGRLPAAVGREIPELVPLDLGPRPDLARVRCQPIAGSLGWAEVADLVSDAARRHLGQVLVVVNTISDAETLYRLLAGSDGLLLLTTRLCPAHRRSVFHTVTADLAAGRPALVISTQMVEAGVDFDFPVGFRAVGPLPSVFQMAGRVNRHGGRGTSDLFVFEPGEGRLPPGEYRRGTDVTRELIRSGRDLLAPATVPDYYDKLVDQSAGRLDPRGINDLRAKQEYEKVAQTFTLIEDESVGVVCPYAGFDPTALGLHPDAATHEVRRAVRSAAPYTVQLRTNKFEEYRQQGLTREIPGTPLVEWCGVYDNDIGLTIDTGMVL